MEFPTRPPRAVDVRGVRGDQAAPPRRLDTNIILVDGAAYRGALRASCATPSASEPASCRPRRRAPGSPPARARVGYALIGAPLSPSSARARSGCASCACAAGERRLLDSAGRVPGGAVVGDPADMAAARGWRESAGLRAAEGAVATTTSVIERRLLHGPRRGDRRGRSRRYKSDARRRRADRREAELARLHRLPALLVGRDEERARLGRMIEAAREGRSAALLVHGEAGMGKTTLLRDAADQAHGMRVLRARGIESESELPFAALSELLVAAARPALRDPARAGAGARRRAGARGDAGDRPLRGRRRRAQPARRGGRAPAGAGRRRRPAVARRGLARGAAVRRPPARRRGRRAAVRAARRRGRGRGRARARPAAAHRPRRGERAGAAGRRAQRLRAAGDRPAAGRLGRQPARAARDPARAERRPARRARPRARAAAAGRDARARLPPPRRRAAGADPRRAARGRLRRDDARRRDRGRARQRRAARPTRSSRPRPPGCSRCAAARSSSTTRSCAPPSTTAPAPPSAATPTTRSPPPSPTAAPSARGTAPPPARCRTPGSPRR